MCKIILIPDAKSVPHWERFTRVCQELLSDMSDGFGYAYQSINGVARYRTTLDGERAWCGEHGKAIGAAMFHGRVSTNTLGLVNTHPIAKNEAYIVHNGVVTHHGESYAQDTQNDTEHVLYNYLSGGIASIADNLTGYYACGIIDADGTFLVFRDGIANLVGAYSVTLGSMVFATNQALLDGIGDYLGETLVGTQVPNDTCYVYKDGVLVDTVSLKSRGYGVTESMWASRSLGYELDSYARAKTWEESNDDAALLDYVSEEYLSEFDYFDHSYDYWFQDKQITYGEFMALGVRDQIECVIYRHDGSEVIIFDLESAAV